MLTFDAARREFDAAARGCLTYVDATQTVGWLPFDAGGFNLYSTVSTSAIRGSKSGSATSKIAEVSRTCDGYPGTTISSKPSA